MSTVAPVTTPTTTSSTSSTQSTAMQQLSGNFDTFLQLLTTQLQNQDPLDPLDSNQFTQQLVEFSQVEQQINTNDNLQNLISLTQGNASNGAVNYLGRTVTITNGDAALQDGEANWTYGLNSQAANTVLTVSDTSGNIVYSTAGETAAGQHSFSWNGQDASGNQLPDGVYTLNVAATAADGSAVTSAVASAGTVDEVNFTGSQPELMIGPMAIPLSQVSAIQ